MTMHYELLANRILERAATHFPNKEIVTRVGEDAHRYTYAEMFTRTRAIGQRLAGTGDCARRSGRHFCLEHLPTPGSVLRAGHHWRGHSYDQHPTGAR